MNSFLSDFEAKGSRRSLCFLLSSSPLFLSVKRCRDFSSNKPHRSIGNTTKDAPAAKQARVERRQLSDQVEVKRSEVGSVGLEDREMT